MAARKAISPAVIAWQPKIHRATLGSLGRVIRGAEITEAEAVVARLAGQDVVVCGESHKANRLLAQRIENAVEKVLEEGLRTADIAKPGEAKVSTQETGDRILTELKKMY